MTASDYRKVFSQLKVKPAKPAKYKKHNAPKKRTCGRALKKCIRSGRIGGVITKYGLKLSRQSFREVALKLGFKKYN